ncbi:MAG: putative porin [Chthoniobacteraceae bacterium]|nr:putative porin [Chthoniobacteraceae bacterium]
MENLVNLLVQQGVIKKPQGDALIQQAEAEAAAANDAALMHAPAPAPVPPPGTEAISAPNAGGAIRVTYIPESVRQQLRDDIKQDVMKEALAENWAAPDSVPAWTKSLRLTGDLRARVELDNFPSGNDPLGFPNFNAINRGSPYNASATNPNYPPFINVNEDRERPRLRARVALDADLGEGFTAGIRIGTGNDDQPVSTNQTLAADGLGSKYAIWLDRGFIKYNTSFDGTDMAFTIGRFDNPFFSTDLIWWSDLGFDGVVAQANHDFGRFRPFGTVGFFPVYNTDFNFSSTQPEKYDSQDKWLAGAQLGTDIKIDKDLTMKVAAAYYDFINTAGKLSDPLYNPSDDGSTDILRPSFAQRGNTYMELRDNAYYTDPNSPYYGENYQYYGLATPYRELAFTGKLDYAHFDPFHIILDGEYVKNVAFDEARINAAVPQNNLDGSGRFDGGDTGWMVRLSLGDAVIEKRWDWQVCAAYKYIESDAVVDSFNDPDFGLGGTNLKGFIFGATVGLSKSVNIGFRWFSADNVSAAPYSADVFQLDLNAKF